MIRRENDRYHNFRTGMDRKRADPSQRSGPNSWTTGAAMPTAVQGPATGVIGGLVYVVGGATSSADVNINQVYDPTTDSWTTGAPMPTARFVPAGAVVNNILYVIGGKLNGNQLNAVEAYDPLATPGRQKPPCQPQETAFKPLLTTESSTLLAATTMAAVVSKR